jgi:hypothetical protein
MNIIANCNGFLCLVYGWSKLVINDDICKVVDVYSPVTVAWF